MKVLLVHNPSAGGGAVAGDELSDLVRAAGHLVTTHRSDRGDVAGALRASGAELLAVAGGDGTVRKVLVELAGSGVTIAVIPTGTANNIARTLGLHSDDPASLVNGWATATTQRFAVPAVSSRSGRSRFVESVGGGLFAGLLWVAEDRERRAGADVDTEGALQMLRDVIDTAPVGRWGIDLDGTDFSGDLLAVEAMNVRSVGPNVVLAPEADTADDRLDVVLVHPDDRSGLAEYVEQLMHAGSGAPVPPPPLETRRCSRVELIAPAGDWLHVDDERWSQSDVHERTDRVIDVEVDGAALDVLVPPGHSRGSRS